MQEKTAIVLFNLGGPDKISSVKPFLFNLFNDKAIISLPWPLRPLLAHFISSRREKKAQGIYEKIGGKSPIVEITRAQADALEKELSYSGNFKVFVAMRYWHPMADEVAAKLLDYQPDQVILLPLYPQFSTTTSKSSIEDFLHAMKNAGFAFNFCYNDNGKKREFFARSGFETEVKAICCYFNQADFILSHAKLIKQKIIESGFDEESRREDTSGNSLAQYRILFSAHGLPQKIIDAGDPYVFQVESCAKTVISKLEELLEKCGILETKKGNVEENNAQKINNETENKERFGKKNSDDYYRSKSDKKLSDKVDARVCYQSKVGPLKWTSPSLESEIKRAAIDGKIPVIVPIAFVSEHSETLVELDIDFKEMAEGLGVKKFVRVPALGLDGHFISGLKDICLKAQNGKSGKTLPFGEKDRVCKKDFCGCLAPNS